MAKFYPAIHSGFHGSEGESVVYEALQRLGGDYTVFHSFRWLARDGRWRSEGEADFLVLNQRLGILSLEVKAGGIDFREGNWIQINRKDKSEKVIDPLGQAAESQYYIQSLLREKCPSYRVMIGRAAWFPSVVLSKGLPLPAESAREILLDQDSLEYPDKALVQAFVYWQKLLNFYMKPLTASQYQSLIQCLMPSFHLAETISSSGRSSRADCVQLTRQQAAILDFLHEQQNAAIHGPAGTGKTLLAIERVKLLASEGKKVLYLCFNEFLLAHLREQIHGPLIVLHNINSLARELLQDDTLPIEKVVPIFEDYFANDFDDNDWPYQDIVVDEGQDFSDGLLSHLSDLAALYGGSCYVFYDRNQYIMRKDKPEWLDKNAECRLVLYKNCRNTSEIASSIGTIMGLRPESYVNEVHGVKPKAAFYRTADELRQIATQFVKRMLSQRMKPEQMVILSVRAVEHSALCGISELGGLPVSLSPAHGTIWFTSVRKFKGMEADAVLLVDVEIGKIADPLTKRLIYVGASRANIYLETAFCENDSKEAYDHVLQSLTESSQHTGRKGLLMFLGMESL